MNLSITFNWPPPDHARVSFGTPNIKDKDWEFRIGVVTQEDKDKIYWLKPGWFSGEIEKEIIFDVERGSKVVVERKRKNAEKAETRNIWDINREWPAEAQGASSTVIPWYF